MSLNPPPHARMPLSPETCRWRAPLTHDGGGTEHEDIQVFEVPLPEADAWLRDRAAAGMLIDPKVYAGLYFASRAL